MSCCETVSGAWTSHTLVGALANVKGNGRRQERLSWPRRAAEISMTLTLMNDGPRNDVLMLSGQKLWSNLL